MKIKFNEVTFFDDLFSDMEVLRDATGAPILFDKEGNEIGKMLGHRIYESLNNCILDIPEDVYLDVRSMDKTVYLISLNKFEDNNKNMVGRDFDGKIVIFNKEGDVVGVLLNNNQMRYKGKVIDVNDKSNYFVKVKKRTYYGDH